jgi:hypothetical protein
MPIRLPDRIIDMFKLFRLSKKTESKHHSEQQLSSAKSDNLNRLNIAAQDLLS